MNDLNTKLKESEFVGIVEDNIDPDKKQRVKIRIPYLHGSISQIPTEALPWSQPKRDNNGIQFTIPEINKIVNVTFPTGNLYYPVYDNAQHLNINLQRKIEEYDGDDYASFISLCYNYNTQIFIDNEGLNIIHKFNQLLIDDSNIIINLKDNSSNLYLGDPTADQEAMLGTNFLKYIDKFMKTMLDAYIGNSGAPVVANPNLINTISEYFSNRKTFLSPNIFLNDVGTIRSNEFEVDGQIGDKIKNINTENELSTTNVELGEPQQNQDENKREIDFKPKSYMEEPGKEESKIFEDTVIKEIDESQLDVSFEDEFVDNSLFSQQSDPGDDGDDLFGNDIYNEDANYFTKDDMKEIAAENTKPLSVPGAGSQAPLPPFNPTPSPASGNKLNDVKKLIRFMKSLSYVVYDEPYRINIVGIRNPNKDNGIITNKFDDYMWVFFKDDTGQWNLYQYNCTTTPGLARRSTVLGNGPGNKGIAMVIYGQYQNTYRIGYHAGRDGRTPDKNGKIRKAHPCLRDSKVYFVRNIPGANRYKTREEIKTTKQFHAGIGTNIHRSGYNNVTKNVFNYSEGCQVFSHYNQHIEFMGLCQQQTEKTQYKKFTYTLIPQSDFDAFK